MDAVRNLTELATVPPWAVFLAATLALTAGVLTGMMITLRHIVTEDSNAAKVSRHQRDPKGRGPASLDWIPGPPERTHMPKGETVLWNPRTDAMTREELTEVMGVVEPTESIDYRAGGRGIR